jgi:SSS family solute:Na+ symporter
MRNWAALLLVATAAAGEFPRELRAYPGKTPKLDGKISPGEYSDASEIRGVLDWTPQFAPTADPRDLALRGWVKHDGRFLYFAFEVTDDVLYGIDTPRWLPDNNPKVHDLTREGFPWFGDEMEILMNPPFLWTGSENAAGNGRSWQMVCNLTKSRRGGVGRGGILEGEPRRDEAAWNTYQRWIAEGAIDCAASVVKKGAPGKEPSVYVLEWAIRFDPCLEVEPGVFYTPAMGDRKMGLNIALGDLDEKERNNDNPYHFHHEDWWAGHKNTRTNLEDFGTLWIMSSKRRP